MRKLLLAIASIALAVLPVLSAGRTVAWFLGPFADQRSLHAIRDAAPEIQPEGDYVSSRDCRGCHPGP